MKAGRSLSYDHFLQEAATLLDIDWRKYRKTGARKRAEARLKQLGLTDWGSLLEHLRADPEEARNFPNRMRVTVSRFFRERKRWHALMEQVIPQLWSGVVPFKVWSAGCCSGEEPYTLAILWLERFGEKGAAKLDILATDLDEAVLGRAAAAIYSQGSMREVPPEILSRYFERHGGGWKLAEKVGRMVRFRRHDLMENTVPEHLDLVLCRYLAFTYYRGERRFRAAHRLWKALKPDGTLMIGRKEGLGPEEEEFFKPWGGLPGVFRKIAASTPNSSCKQI